ncbi:hypothetical protein [Ornithinimicrobium kibberense]|uniref:hypothetical protein n=1 Tax=Ornithinimicrobium kibberense TaxID=282060 RepID=UPI003613E5E9
MVGGEHEQRVAVRVGEVDRGAGVDVRRQLLGPAVPGHVEEGVREVDGLGGRAVRLRRGAVGWLGAGVRGHGSLLVAGRRRTGCGRHTVSLAIGG